MPQGGGPGGVPGGGPGGSKMALFRALLGGPSPGPFSSPPNPSKPSEIDLVMLIMMFIIIIILIQGIIPHPCPVASSINSEGNIKDKLTLSFNKNNETKTRKTETKYKS